MMRRAFRGTRRLTLKSLYRLRSDEGHNLKRAVFLGTMRKHKKELLAINYVIEVLEFGKSSYLGRPSNKALEYLARCL
jgi:hypothetical protein